MHSSWRELVHVLVLFSTFPPLRAQFVDCGFDYDCESCIENGCYWCPGDALCVDDPTIRFNLFSHCTTESDYVQDSCTAPSNFFDDPMYSGQAWVYDMINVRPVWERQIFGANVRVRVNDNGVDANHAEFLGRFDIDASCSTYLPGGLDSPGSLSSSHGTSVAAIVGAAANNSDCSVGIAPKVNISSCYAFDGSNFLNVKLDSYDISQNSYGVDGCQIRADFRRELQTSGECPFVYDGPASFPCSVCDFSDGMNGLGAICESRIVIHCRSYYENDVLACSEFLDLILGGNCLYDVLDERERNAITRGIVDGRDGKGIIYVFSAGNAFSTGDDTNVQMFTNTRFIISVGAVGKDGLHARYSTPGASLFITAPGGDFENVSNQIVAGNAGTCRDAGSGTSFSCPVVSGVVALVLEVNPALTWRDVQHIFAQTSKPIEDFKDSTSFKNAAGFWHSNLYGFGMVDAAAAVEMAESWENVSGEKLIVEESGILNIPLLDDKKAVVTSSIGVDSGDSIFIIESVVVQLDVEYVARGHLEIVLTSPQGTRSILHPGRRPENTQLDTSERWKLMTLRNWGESPYGTWNLSLVDLKTGDAGDCISAPWQLLFNDGDQTVDCNYIDSAKYCVDGEIDPYKILRPSTVDYIFQTKSNGRLAAEACCACGGGINREEITDQLKQWRLIVYGREEVATNTPSITPSETPSNRPSLVPSISTRPSMESNRDRSDQNNSQAEEAPVATLSKLPSNPSFEPSMSLAPGAVSSTEPTVTGTPSERMPTFSPGLADGTDSPTASPTAAIETIPPSILQVPTSLPDLADAPNTNEERPSFVPSKMLGDFDETDFPTAGSSSPTLETLEPSFHPSVNPSSRLLPSSVPTVLPDVADETEIPSIEPSDPFTAIDGSIDTNTEDLEPMSASGPRFAYTQLSLWLIVAIVAVNHCARFLP